MRNSVMKLAYCAAVLTVGAFAVAQPAMAQDEGQTCIDRCAQMYKNPVQYNQCVSDCWVGGGPQPQAHHDYRKLMLKKG